MPSPFEARQAREAMVTSIMEELQKLGCFVTDAAPLHAERLRFEVLDDQRELILEKLATWEWSCRPCGTGSRIIPEGNGAVMRPTTSYELTIPREKAPASKPAGREVLKSDEYRALLEGFRKSLG